MIQTRPGVLWQPTTYQQLTNAARNGDLSEATLRIEFKQRLGQTPSARKSFAKELASLALDGGVLIVGITDESDRDPDNPMTALNPQPLQGLTDRIEQIAGTVPDPPIQVHCHELRETPTDTDGFVVVQIPASGIGPHMVDGCYYGRVGTQRQPLTDAQVLLHHQSRPATQDRTLEALNKFQQHWSKRPTDQSGQIPAQLYLVAVPAITRRDMAADWLHRGRGQTSNAFVHAHRSHPDTVYVERRSTMSKGIRWSNTTDNPNTSTYNKLQVLEITEDATISYFSDRIGARRPDQAMQLFLDHLCGRIHGFLNLVADFTNQIGYTGTLDIALTVDNILNARAHVPNGDGFGFPYYDQEYFTNTITQPSLTLGQHARTVTGELVLSLLRTLGASELPNVKAHLDNETSDS